MINAQDSVTLAEISNELKQMKNYIRSVERDVKMQSNSLAIIQRMLQDFGEALSPLLKSKANPPETHKPESAVKSQNDAKVKENQKQEHVQVNISSAKSFHAVSVLLQADDDTKTEKSGPTLPSSKSTPTFHSLTTPSSNARRHSFIDAPDRSSKRDKIRARSKSTVSEWSASKQECGGIASERGSTSSMSRNLQIKCSSDASSSRSPETAIARHKHDSTKDRLGIITPSDKDNKACQADSESSNCNKNRAMSNIADNSTTRSTLIDAGAAVSCGDITSPKGNDIPMKNVNVKIMAKAGSRSDVPFENHPNLHRNNSTEAGDDESGQHKGLSQNRVYSCTDITSSSHPTVSDEEDHGIKRQLSNSSSTSADSAPPGIQIKFRSSEEEEDVNAEIKIAPMPHPAFTHRAVQIKTTNSKYFYDLKEHIGGGRFGRVYRCVEKKTGLVLAAKCFKCKRPHETSGFRARSLNQPISVSVKRTDQEPVDKDDVRNEIAIMNSIDHENIVKLYDAFEHDNAMTLIIEYMDGGEMFERVLADRSQLTECDAILYTRQICNAVQYLHKNLILHLDLKPENILCLDRKSHHLKIIDFGLARKHNPRQKLLIRWGTPEFMAPEVLNYEHVSIASDMWSIGVITHILMSGISPFLGNDDKETIENIVDGEWEFDEHFDQVSEDAKNFISRLLVVDKRGRMSASQCLRHDWLAKPLTTQRARCLESKKQLKKFMARTHWKAGMAAVAAVNWLFRKSSPYPVNTATSSDGTSV